MFRRNGINLDYLQDNEWFNQDLKNLKEGYEYSLGVIGMFSLQIHSGYSWLKCRNICQIHKIELCVLLLKVYILSLHEIYTSRSPAEGNPCNLIAVK